VHVVDRLPKGSIAARATQSGSIFDSAAARWLIPAMATAAGCVAVYLLSGPPHVGDLAAQVARADLFGKAGFTPWFAGWYGGLHLGGYSLVTPELMWWLRPTGVALACVVLTPAFGFLLMRAAGARRPRAGATALTVFQLADLLSGRVTFAAGTVVLLAALISVEKDRSILAALLGLLVSVTSPIAGLIAIVLAVAYLIRSWPNTLRVRTERAEGASPAVPHLKSSLMMAVGAGFGIVLLVRMFPDPGYEPISFRLMWPALLICLVVAVLPVGSLVRRAAVLSAVLVLGCFIVHSPIGTNATRLPLLMAVPAVVASMRGRGIVVLCAAIGLSVWPAMQLHDDLAGASAPSTHSPYYSSLIAELADNPLVVDHRVEVVEPRNHWEVVYLASTVTLARGWERQLDTKLNPALYSRDLTATQYRAFLDRNAVGLVAAPHHTRHDFGAVAEARLVRAGLPYLQAIWSDQDWTLYEVVDPSPIASGDGAIVTSLTSTGLRLNTTGAGTVTLRLRYSPYLAVTGGSVARSSAGDAVLHLSRGGAHNLHAVWSFHGVVSALFSDRSPF
jgi:hypothetical protein